MTGRWDCWEVPTSLCVDGGHSGGRLHLDNPKHGIQLLKCVRQHLIQQCIHSSPSVFLNLNAGHAYSVRRLKHLLSRCCTLLLFNKIPFHPKSQTQLPGGVGRRHMVLKCLGVVLQSSAEVEREFTAEDPLEFWDDG